jgi:hypothetical protein
MVLLQWLVGAFFMFLLLPICLAAIWFGLTDNLRNTFLILSGSAGLFFIFKLMEKFDWKK